MARALTRGHAHPLQYGSQIESLQAGLRESEVKKADLEDALRRLNDELLALRTQERVLLSSEFDREQVSGCGQAH